MNELLQKHGCSNVFSVPEGLKELMSDISREVLREQPTNIFGFIANYLSALMITREHGFLAVKILDDLCDCRPTVSQHLLQVGFDEEQAKTMAQIIKEEIEGFEPVDGKEKIKESQILNRILKKMHLDEVMAAKVCQVARNTYRDYWYRRENLKKTLKTHPDETWEIAAQHTLEIYKKTMPSLEELSRAAEKIQAAYKGYYVRRNLLQYLKSRKKDPKLSFAGPPLDIGGSGPIEFGPIINVKIQEDNMQAIFEEVGTQDALPYDPRYIVTDVPKDHNELNAAARGKLQVSTQEKPSPILPKSSANPIYKERLKHRDSPKQFQIVSPKDSIEKNIIEIVNSEKEKEIIPPQEINKDQDEIHEEFHADASMEESLDDSVNDKEETYNSISEAIGDIAVNSIDTGSINEDISDGELEELEEDVIDERKYR